MANTKKRAAVVVPTAFLVALSGFGMSAPAFAAEDNETSIQSVIQQPGQQDVTLNVSAENETRYVLPADANGGPITATIRHETAGQYFEQGHRYWVRAVVEQYTGDTPEYVWAQFDVETVQAATLGAITLPAPLSAGMTVTVDVFDMGESDDAANSIYSIDGDLTNEETDDERVTAIEAGTLVDLFTLEGRGTPSVDTAPTSPDSFMVGVAQNVRYTGLTNNRDYVLRIGDRIVGGFTATGSAQAVQFIAAPGEVGAQQLRLYDVTDSDGYAEAESDAARLVALNNIGAPVHTEDITVTGQQARAVIVDDGFGAGDAASDGQTVAGAPVQVSFSNLAPIANSANYVVQKYVGGVLDTEWRPGTEIDTTQAYWSWTFTDSAVTTATNITSTVEYRLSAPGGSSLTAPVTILRPEAELSDDSFGAVAVGDTVNVDFHRVAEDGDRYYVVESKDGVVTRVENVTSIVANPDVPGDNVASIAVPTAGVNAQGEYSYQLYWLREGENRPETSGTSAAQAAALARTAVAQLATPFTVDVESAELARVNVSPRVFGAEETVTFSFENLDELEQPATGDAFFAIQTVMVGGTVVDQRVLGEVVEGGEFATISYDPRDNADEVVKVELYRGDANALTQGAPDSVGVIARAASGGLVQNQNGDDLVGVAMGENAPETQAPGTGTGEDGPGTENPVPESRVVWSATGMDGAAPSPALQSIPISVTGDNIFFGDWDGDGVDTPGYRFGDNSFVFAASNEADTAWSAPIDFGRSGDQIFVGDWDGDGRATLGLRRGIEVFLNNENVQGNAEIQFDFGRQDDQVVVGDWDADGTDTIGLRRGIWMYLSNDFEGGWAEIDFTYGRTGDQVYVGDWDGDGADAFAVRRGNVYFLTNGFEGGWAERETTLGTSDQFAVVANTEADGQDYIYVLNPTTVEIPAED